MLTTHVIGEFDLPAGITPVSDTTAMVTPATHRKMPSTIPVICCARVGDDAAFADDPFELPLGVDCGLFPMTQAFHASQGQTVRPV